MHIVTLFHSDSKSSQKQYLIKDRKLKSSLSLSLDKGWIKYKGKILFSINHWNFKVPLWTRTPTLTSAPRSTLGRVLIVDSTKTQNPPALGPQGVPTVPSHLIEMFPQQIPLLLMSPSAADQDSRWSTAAIPSPTSSISWKILKRGEGRTIDARRRIGE